MKSALVIITILSLIIPITGCIEEFAVATERESGILVINGRITNGLGPHEVTISRTTEENRVTLPEGGGRVTLVDSQGNTYEFFQETPGRFILPEGYASIFPGLSYKISVELNGSKYESTLTRLNDILSRDSIGYRFEDEVKINDIGNEVITPKYNVYLKSTTPFVDTKQYFKWEATEVFTLPRVRPDDPPCFLSRRIDPQRVVIAESVKGNELILDDVLLASKNIDDAFSIKQFTLVSQLNISEEEYTYWKNVRTSIEQVGSIFDIPPARIRGNITNVDDPAEVVYGYFSVAAEKTVRYFILREDVPRTITSLCRGAFFNRPPFCFCEGGIARPPYF